MLFQNTPAMLPFELYDEIFSFVTHNQDLRNLCLASSRFLPIAQRHLYRSVVVRELVPIIRFCQVVIGKPHLANYVRSLVMFGPPFRLEQEFDGWHQNSRPVFASGYVRLIFRALRQMNRLKRLQLPSFSPTEQFNANLADCHFQLTYLRVTGDGCISSTFLELQPSLLELEVSDFAGVEAGAKGSAGTPPKVLQGLQTLSAPVDVVTDLVPYRPLKRIDISEAMDSAFLCEMLPSLSLSTGPVQALHLELFDIQPGTIEELAFYLCHLEELKLYLCIDDGPDVVQAIQSIGDATTAFRKFQSLRQLDIWNICNSLAESDYGQLVVGIGKATPTLAQVLFSGWNGDELSDVSYLRRVLGDKRRDDRNGWERRVMRRCIRRVE